MFLQLPCSCSVIFIIYHSATSYLLLRFNIFLLPTLAFWYNYRLQLKLLSHPSAHDSLYIVCLNSLKPVKEHNNIFIMFWSNLSRVTSISFGSLCKTSDLTSTENLWDNLIILPAERIIHHNITNLVLCLSIFLHLDFFI